MDLFNQPPPNPKAVKAKEEGMKRAIDHADAVHGNWSDVAYLFLVGNIPEGPFMTEDIRFLSEGHVPEPPSKRAWGPIILRAAKEGRVHKIGATKVKDANGHQGYATLWQKL